MYEENGPWKLMLRDEVLNYITDFNIPSTNQLNLFGTEQTVQSKGCRQCKATFGTDVRTSKEWNEYGTGYDWVYFDKLDVGCFGEDEFYFFYMRFHPKVNDFNGQGAKFSIWFQIGDEDSEWQGVSWEFNT